MKLTYIGYPLKKSDFSSLPSGDWPEKFECAIRAEIERDMCGHIDVAIIGVETNGGVELGTFLKSETAQLMLPVLRSYFLNTKMRGHESEVGA